MDHTRPEDAESTSKRPKADDLDSNSRFIGTLLITGIDSDDDDDDDDNEGERNPRKDLTQDQLSKLRYVMITANIDKEIRKSMKFVDPHDGMFNTHSGNIVIAGIPGQIKKALKAKAVSSRFDALFGLTFALWREELWMMDNEEWGEGGELDHCINMLAAAWKRLLQSSNEELGIDAEYTRPGVENMLTRFQELVAETDSVAAEFKWK